MKERARATVEQHAGSLLELSHDLHAHPETAMRETRSAGAVASALEGLGFAVERGVADLPTAFRATYGSGALRIGICAEYDALPGAGHACGHNIIASSAVGCAAALAPLADELDITIVVLGTPAEEGGAGKIFMLQRGAFDNLHASLMVHAAAYERDNMASLANARFTVTYTGKAAHAAAAPERGINAAAAQSLAHVGIGMLREHLLATDRVHGIVTQGGDAMNIVPEKTVSHWCTRAASVERHAVVFQRVVDVFKGAAMMTGCTLDITIDDPLYAEVRPDSDLLTAWRNNASALGRTSLPQQSTDGYASTDMGNVSYAMPSIHPLIALDSGGANIHEAAFAECAAAATGDRAVVDGATLLAWTVIDAATNSALRQRLLAKAFRVADIDPAAAWLDLGYDKPLHFAP